MIVNENTIHNKGFQTFNSSNSINFHSEKDVINTLYATLVLLFCIGYITYVAMWLIFVEMWLVYGV